MIHEVSLRITSESQGQILKNEIGHEGFVNASQSGPTFSGPNFSGPKILAGVGPEW
jgi:hypothetical protein